MCHAKICICSTMTFLRLGNFDHLFVSDSIHFSSNSKLDVHFYCTSYSYSSAGWDGFSNHLRDVTWGYDLNNFYFLWRIFQEAPSYSSNSTGFKKKGNKKGSDLARLFTVEGLPFLDFQEEFDLKKRVVLGPKLLHMKLKVVVNISLKLFPIFWKRFKMFQINFIAILCYLTMDSSVMEEEVTYIFCDLYTMKAT